MPALSGLPPQALRLKELGRGVAECSAAIVWPRSELFLHSRVVIAGLVLTCNKTCLSEQLALLGIRLSFAPSFRW